MTYTNQVLEVVTPDGQIFRHPTLLPDGFEVTNFPGEFTRVERASEPGRPSSASDRWMQEPDPRGRFTINWYALPPGAPAYMRRALIAQHHFVVGPDAHQLMTEAVDR